MADSSTADQPSHGIDEQTDIESQRTQIPVDVDGHGIQQHQTDEHNTAEGEGHDHNVGAYRGQGVGERTVIDGVDGHDIDVHPCHGSGEHATTSGHGHEFDETAAQDHHGVVEHTTSGIGNGQDAGLQQHDGESPDSYQGPISFQELQELRGIVLELVAMAQELQARRPPPFTQFDPLGLGDPGNPGSHRHWPGRMYPLGASLPAHILVRPDGVQIPMPFPPGQLVNPLHMNPSSSSHPAAAPGPSDPQGSMIDHPAHHQSGPMPMPQVYSHTRPQAQAYQLSSTEQPRTPEPLPQSNRSLPSATTSTPAESSPSLLRAGILLQPDQRRFAGSPDVQNPDQSSSSLPQVSLPVRQSDAASMAPQRGQEETLPTLPNLRETFGAILRATDPPAPFPTEEGSEFARTLPSVRDLFGHLLPRTAPPAPANTEEGSNLETAATLARSLVNIPDSIPSQPDLAEREAPVPVPTADLPKLGSSSRPLTTAFDNITAATAKCDVCNQRNSAGLTRCFSCGWQTCHTCTIENGCIRHHVAGGLHHISPITESELIPLQRRQATTKRRKTDNGTDQSHTRGKPNEASEDQPSTNERVPANNTSVVQTKEGKAKAPAKRKPAERRATTPKPKPVKTTKPKAPKAEKPKPARKPAAKKGKGRGKADEEAQAADSDTDSATSSVVHGALALCEYSGDAFMLYGEREPQTQAHVATHTMHAQHQVGDLSQRVENQAAANRQTNGVSRQATRSSQRIANSERTVSQAVRAPRQAAAASQHAEGSAQTRKRRYSVLTISGDEPEEENDDDDLYGISDDSSTDGYAYRRRPQMLGSKPPADP